ncbi:LysR substrate-binding domain-containing protein [Luteimonas sp. RD2P54]|uniref:LysR substrate-binding domain-containing protein n=1 Tax=Luteimonas endophytica TaxID=3042023 RepID=A0ABT6JA09_9GAMM|nr:LysR substrate-binding domain-containing protein [Luteimonas endophytica]MDH5823660.1 LysR substrate-binding domain-containing protein [Luteimonas endophytica]
MSRLPSLSALRAFEATARLGSAKRAAMELSVTPAAISHQLRQLEAELGQPLFVRRPRQLLVTPQGRELQRALTGAFAAIVAAADRVRAPQRRSLTLSATPAVASRWLVPRLPQLREACPGLDLRIHVSHEPVALDGVEADLAIRYGGGQWPGLRASKLFDNVFAPVCSPRLQLRDPGQLSRQTLLHFAPPGARSAPVDWTAWQRRARVPGLDPGKGPVFSDETHAISAALAGQGVALMSLALVADELRAGSLMRPFGPELQAEPFHLVHPEDEGGDCWMATLREWILNLPPLALPPPTGAAPMSARDAVSAAEPQRRSRRGGRARDPA